VELQRLQREQKQRRAVFVDWFDMDMLAALAEKSPPDIVFVTGHADNLPGEDVLIDAALLAGWKIDRYINVSEREGERRLAVTYTRDGAKIEVRSAAEWVGPDLHAALAQRAWDRLRHDLQAAFGERAVLLSSPAQTGQDVLERSLPRQKGEGGTLTPYTFPTIPDAALDVLYTTSGQGRMELFPHERPIERLYGLDGVWMYAACLSNLPSGPLTMDTKTEPPGWATGFLTASVRVPDTWAHIGLLPEVYDGDDGLTHRRWPRTPGQWFASVMTTAEYGLAVSQGWDIRIKRRYLWHKPLCDPARPWRDKLVSLRERYETQAKRGDIVAKALAGTVRRLMLNTIGLWFSHQAFTDGYVRREDVSKLMGEHPGAQLRVHGRHWFYVRIPRDPAGNAWQHPEWAAQVWGKARARLASVALGMPFDSLVSLRTDAIWATYDPGWPDVGKPGTFRLKEIVEGPLSAPRNESDMRLLLSQARRV
jgi:hypothetical protein